MPVTRRRPLHLKGLCDSSGVGLMLITAHPSSVILPLFLRLQQHMECAESQRPGLVALQDREYLRGICIQCPKCLTPHSQNMGEPLSQRWALYGFLETAGLPTREAKLGMADLRKLLCKNRRGDDGQIPAGLCSDSPKSPSKALPHPVFRL